MNFLAFFVQWLLAASLRASLLAAAVIMLQIVWGRRLSARCRYAFWLPVVLTFIMPALLGWTVQHRLALLETAIPPSAMLLLRSDFAAVTTMAASLPSLLYKYSFLPAAWLLGASAVLAVAGIGYWRTLRQIQSGAMPVDPLLTDAVALAARQIRLPRLPLVVLSTAVESPAVTGLFRAVLLLPKDFLVDFTPAEIRLILLHELTHLRRYDLPLNWFLCVLQASHWFNPWLWFVFSRIRSAREEACDAQALSACEEDRRAEYGHALLKLHGAQTHASLNLAFAGAFARDRMRSRLLAITCHRETHPAWNAIGAVMIAGLMLLGLTQLPVGHHKGEAASGHGLSLYASSAVKPNVVPPVAQTPTTNPRNALPEWWPAASSARILFNRELTRKGVLNREADRLIAAAGRTLERSPGAMDICSSAYRLY